MKVANIIIFISLVIFVCSAAIANASSSIILQLNARVPASIEISKNMRNKNSDLDIRSNSTASSIRIKRNDKAAQNKRIYTVIVN